MSPYKNFVSTGKVYLNSNGFLRFLLSAHIAVFALGGLFYLLGIFLVNLGGFGGVSVYDAFSCLGIILMWGGLLLCIFAEDPLSIVIGTGSVAVCSLVAWIVLLARSYPFMFQPLLYFLVFGTICILMAIKGEKFAKRRAEAAARSVVACPRCGAGIPKAAAFCPVCGAPNPLAQYSQPAQPQYAPPTGQPYAPPAGQPQYAPPVPPQYAPPVPPQYAPVGQPQYAPPAPPVQPQYAPPAPPPFVPVAPEAPAAPQATAVPEAPQAPLAADMKKCVNCGTELPAEAVFCGKCGTRQ